jgi:hypothetical protein
MKASESRLAKKGDGMDGALIICLSVCKHLIATQGYHTRLRGDTKSSVLLTQMQTTTFRIRHAIRDVVAHDSIVTLPWVVVIHAGCSMIVKAVRREEPRRPPHKRRRLAPRRQQTSLPSDPQRRRRSILYDRRISNFLRHHVLLHRRLPSSLMWDLVL